MKQITLGKTGLSISCVGFGALPIQRLSTEEAVTILRAARAAGITFYDTARAYTDSECKLGAAFGDMPRGEIVIATKSGAKDGQTMRQHLAESLKNLRTDYVDVYQFHNPSFIPRPGGADGLYDAALEAKAAGKIRHIGITQHSLDGAFEAVESGLYDTLQYPFNHISSQQEIELVEACRRHNMGFIAMKGMSGGLITNAALPFAFLRQYDHVIPIWGVQRMAELNQFIDLEKNPPPMDEAMRQSIARDREELGGAFCCSCGYCMPCPKGIQINNVNRMIQLLTRSPQESWLSEYWQKEMERSVECVSCGLCHTRCPYHLKPYETMPAHLEYYRKVLAEKAK